RTISVASSSWAPARRTAQVAASRARRRIPQVLSNRFAIRAMAFPPPIVPFLVLRFPGARLGTPHRLRGLEPGRPPGGEQGAEPHRHRHGDGGVEDVRGPYGAVELVGQAGLLESLADGGEQGAQEVVAGQKPGDAVAQDKPDPPADGAGQERLVGDQGAQPPGRQGPLVTYE